MAEASLWPIKQALFIFYRISNFQAAFKIYFTHVNATPDSPLCPVPLPLFVARCCGFALLRVFVVVVVVVTVLDWNEGKVFVEFGVCL